MDINGKQTDWEISQKQIRNGTWSGSEYSLQKWSSEYYIRNNFYWGPTNELLRLRVVNDKSVAVECYCNNNWVDKKYLDAYYNGPTTAKCQYDEKSLFFECSNKCFIITKDCDIIEYLNSDYGTGTMCSNIIKATKGFSYITKSGNSNEVIINEINSGEKKIKRVRVDKTETPYDNESMLFFDNGNYYIAHKSNANKMQIDMIIE
jgi:hypothetical protein